MSIVVDKIVELVDGLYDQANFHEAMKPPEVFRDRDQMASPSELGEWAAYIAAHREFVAEQLQEARRMKAVVSVMHKTAVDAHQDKMDSALADNAGALIARGFAMQERLAHTKVSLVEGSVEVRASEIQLKRLEAAVETLDHCHREWRAGEFTLDRMIRLTQLRLQMSEI